MKNVLIVGQGTEIAKLFELLMQQRDRQFVSARNLEQCLDLAARTQPTLIIFDSEIADAKACCETLAALKEKPMTNRIPVFLINAPERTNSEANALKALTEGALTEPFNPAEIKKIAEKYLS